MIVVINRYMEEDISLLSSSPHSMNDSFFAKMDDE